MQCSLNKIPATSSDNLENCIIGCSARVAVNLGATVALKQLLLAVTKNCLILGAYSLHTTPFNLLSNKLLFKPLFIYYISN